MKLSKVEIRSNGNYNADTVEVTIEGKEHNYDWHLVNPSVLYDLFRELGHEVTWDNDVKFGHDED